MFIDGLIKPHSPGSLREPAKTYLLPSDWSMLPLAFGLLMGEYELRGERGSIYRSLMIEQRHGEDIVFSQISIAICDIRGNLLGD